jgi:hypothetical protein
MSKKIVEMAAENDYINLQNTLQKMLAKKIVKKIQGKKVEFIQDLKEKRKKI